MASYIAQNINRIRMNIPSCVKIIAISKTKTVPQIREAFQSGQICFGENRIRELSEKNKQFPEAEWQFIGHLQTNKVKYIASFVQMIQSVDSFRVLEEINRQASKYERIIDCLLQIHIAREETKSGLSEQETIDLLEHNAWQTLKHIRICGLMGMASFTDDEAVIRNEFRGLANFFQRIRRDYFADYPSFCEISMGMSDDYPIAVEEGATMIRIGSLIFGEREKIIKQQ